MSMSQQQSKCFRDAPGESSSQMKQFKKKRREPLIRKSLSVVLAAMQGERVKIELKSDVEVEGTIESTGHGMDLQLVDVQSILPNKSLRESDSMLLLGESIRFVHIPPNINVTSHLSQYMRKVDSRAFKTTRISDKPKKALANTQEQTGGSELDTKSDF